MHNLKLSLIYQSIGCLKYSLHNSRARSHRNLVLGYERARIFPAGVELDSLEEMQQTGCVRDSTSGLRRPAGLVGLGWCSPGAPFPSSNLVTFGSSWHARGRGHCRVKPGRAQHAQTYRITLYRAIQSKARTGRFLREKLILTTVGFLPTSTIKKRRTRKIPGATLRMHRALDGRTLVRSPALPAQGLHRHEPRCYNF